MTDSAFITKYRPTSFDQVIGQDKVVKSFRSALDKKRGKAFLFVGPSGTGKTTLAYLGAEQVGCARGDAIEIDAATHTGIDDMRAITEELRFRPLGSETKAIIVDELQALSKNAFQSLLKILEDPPEWVYWFLCTTEPTKVPKNIVTRCIRYDLKPVDADTLFDMLVDVVEAEKLKTSEKLIDLCVRHADGSPRQALVNLVACAEAKNVAEGAELLQSAEYLAEAVDVARALVKGERWGPVRALLQKLKQTSVNPESVRHVVNAYVSSVALGSNDKTKLEQSFRILEAFGTPFNSSDGIAPLLVACGKVVLGWPNDVSGKTRRLRDDD